MKVVVLLSVLGLAIACGSEPSNQSDVSSWNFKVRDIKLEKQGDNLCIYKDGEFWRSTNGETLDKIVNSKEFQKDQNFNGVVNSAKTGGILAFILVGLGNATGLWNDAKDKINAHSSNAGSKKSLRILEDFPTVDEKNAKKIKPFFDGIVNTSEKFKTSLYKIVNKDYQGREVKKLSNGEFTNLLNGNRDQLKKTLYNLIDEQNEIIKSANSSLTGRALKIGGVTLAAAVVSGLAVYSFNKWQNGTVRAIEKNLSNLPDRQFYELGEYFDSDYKACGFNYEMMQ